MHYIGVDVSSDTLEVYKAHSDEHLSLANTADQIAVFVEGLDEESQVVLEPTSTYHHVLLSELIARDISYTLINPRATAAYSRALNLRAKTDKVDAKMLADFASVHNLEPSNPPDQAQQQLKTLRRHLEWLDNEINAARNRLGAAKRSPWTPQPVIQSLERTIDQLKSEVMAVQEAIDNYLAQHQGLGDQINLMASIDGIGTKTAVMMLSEMPDVDQCKRAKDWVAFCGVNPQVRQSGKASFSRMSRMGNSRIRAKLYLPAITALRVNPLIKDLGNRLKAKGKSGKLIIVAAMNKLIRLCFGVLKSGRPFDLSMHQQSS